MKKKLEKLNINEILKKNPSVDLKQMEEILVILGELRSKGFRKQGYNLVTPFSRRLSSNIAQDSIIPSHYYLQPTK